MSYKWLSKGFILGARTFFFFLKMDEEIVPQIKEVQVHGLANAH